MVGTTHLICMKMPHLVGKDKYNKIMPLDLQGMGNTSSNPQSEPWMVTCTTTRTSYIFFKGEHISASYIQEKLHVYEKSHAKAIAQSLHELLGPKEVGVNKPEQHQLPQVIP